MLWAAQSQGQWWSISTEMSPDTEDDHPRPSQRSGGCSTITEEREVSWSRQHPSWDGASRWRGCHYRSHDNLQQDLADRRMVNPMSLFIALPRKATCSSARTTERSAHQSPKQNHAEDHTEQIEATGGEDHRWRTGRLQSRQEHHRADLQPTNPLWENISSTSKTSTMSS